MTGRHPAPIITKPEVNHEVADPVPELSAFMLPGRVTDPAAGLHEAIQAERVGLGTVWLSERYDLKDIGVLGGAVGALTQRIRFGSGLVAVGARHPLVTATWAATMQAVFGDRLIVGLGRGNEPSLAPHGMPVTDFAATADYADILRRLWRGEVVDYDGPLGRFPSMAMADTVELPPPPLVLGGFGGRRSMELAGTHFDGVFLMPFLTTEAVAESIRFRDEAAERAGRDPREIRIIHEIVTAPNFSELEVLATVYARALTYLQMGQSGEVLMRRNRWDEADLGAVRSHPMFAGTAQA